MDQIGDFLDETHLTDAAKTMCNFCGQTDKVILANGNDFHTVRKLKKGKVQLFKLPEDKHKLQNQKLRNLYYGTRTL